jgi:hypothetical protein
MVPQDAVSDFLLVEFEPHTVSYNTSFFFMYGVSGASCISIKKWDRLGETGSIINYRLLGEDEVHIIKEIQHILCKSICPASRQLYLLHSHNP